MAKPRGVFVAGNWKMNHGPAAARAFISELGSSLTPAFEKPGLRTALLAPAVTLAPALEAVKATPALQAFGPGFLQIGAQNAHGEASGAYTGELSGGLLQEIGVGLTLVGHSERRQYFGETDETASQRLVSLMRQGLEVIFCIGETLAQRQAGQTETVVLRQLNWADSVANFTAKSQLNWSKLVIAYEPVWAIGTGVTATPQQAQEVHALIRKWLVSKGSEAAKTPVLYGGSVTPENFASLLACPDVDGGLVGGASLKAASFLKLIEAGAQAI